jgi:hypothetical protein
VVRVIRDGGLVGILRDRLAAALRNRDLVAVSALRSALAAIGNAEAVPPDRVPLAGPANGPIIQYVFKPLLTGHGALASALGPAFRVGPGRGIGLLFVLIGLAMVITTLAGAVNPRLRAVEDTAPPVPVAEPALAVVGGA